MPVTAPNLSSPNDRKEKTMDEQRKTLTYDEALAMLPDKLFIHTFRNGNMMLTGTDWERAKIEAALAKYQRELAGPMATRMGHGLVIQDENGPLFIETKKDVV